MGAPSSPALRPPRSTREKLLLALLSVGVGVAVLARLQQGGDTVPGLAVQVAALLVAFAASLPLPRARRWGGPPLFLGIFAAAKVVQLVRAAWG